MCILVYVHGVKLSSVSVYVCVCVCTHAVYAVFCIYEHEKKQVTQSEPLCVHDHVHGVKSVVKSVFVFVHTCRQCCVLYLNLRKTGGRLKSAE